MDGRTDVDNGCCLNYKLKIQEQYTYNKSGSSCHNLKGELTYGKFMILDELTYDMVQLVLQYGVNRLRPTF